MKKFLAAAIAAGFVAAPAFAASITVSFAKDDGTTQEWTFDGEGTATSGDVSASYTMDEEAGVLCATMPDESEICVTFDEAVAQEVGASSTYSLSTGGTGTATITAMTE